MIQTWWTMKVSPKGHFQENKQIWGLEDYPNFPFRSLVRGYLEPMRMTFGFFVKVKY